MAQGLVLQGLHERTKGRPRVWFRVTTGAAVLSLAVAMGACAAAFRLVDALFLRPMPVRDPGIFGFVARIRLQDE